MDNKFRQSKSIDNLQQTCRQHVSCRKAGERILISPSCIPIKSMARCQQTRCNLRLGWVGYFSVNIISQQSVYTIGKYIWYCRHRLSTNIQGENLHDSNYRPITIKRLRAKTRGFIATRRRCTCVHSRGFLPYFSHNYNDAEWVVYFPQCHTPVVDCHFLQTSDFPSIWIFSTVRCARDISTQVWICSLDTRQIPNNW